MDVTLKQYGFRFVNDDGDEDESTFAAGENTNLSSQSEVKRIRFTIDVTGTEDPPPVNYGIEYRHKPSGGNWSDWSKIYVN